MFNPFKCLFVKLFITSLLPNLNQTVAFKSFFWRGSKLLPVTFTNNRTKCKRNKIDHISDYKNSSHLLKIQFSLLYSVSFSLPCAKRFRLFWLFLDELRMLFSLILVDMMAIIHTTLLLLKGALEKGFFTLHWLWMHAIFLWFCQQKFEFDFWRPLIPCNIHIWFSLGISRKVY